MKSFVLISVFFVCWTFAAEIKFETHPKFILDGDKDIKVKTRIIEKKIPVPYTVEKRVPYTVYKKVPYKVKVPVPEPYIVEKKVPYPVKEYVKVPYYVPKPYEVIKKVPYEVKVPVPRPVEVKIAVPKPYVVEKKVPKPIKVYVPQPYTVEKKVPYPVKVLVPVPQPYTVEKRIPYEVKVPIERPYIVEVPKPFPVPFEEHIPVPVERPIPYEVKVPVDRPYPVEVPKKIPIPVKYPTEELDKKPPSSSDLPIAAALTRDPPQGSNFDSSQYSGYSQEGYNSVNPTEYNNYEQYYPGYQQQYGMYGQQYYPGGYSDNSQPPSPMFTPVDIPQNQVPQNLAQNSTQQTGAQTFPQGGQDPQNDGQNTIQSQIQPEQSNSQDTQQNSQTQTDNSSPFQQSVQQMQAGIVQSSFQESPDPEPKSNYTHLNTPGLGQFSDENGNSPSYEPLVQQPNLNQYQNSQAQDMHISQPPQSQHQYNYNHAYHQIHPSHPQMHHYQQYAGYEQQMQQMQGYHHPYENYGHYSNPNDYYYNQHPSSYQHYAGPVGSHKPYKYRMQRVMNPKEQQVSQEQPHVVKYETLVVHTHPQKSAPNEPHSQPALESQSRYESVPAPQQQIVEMHAGYKTAPDQNPDYSSQEYGVEYSDGVLIQSNNDMFQSAANENGKFLEKEDNHKKSIKRVGKAIDYFEASESPWIASNWTPIEEGSPR